ncbi:hypothetical protein BDW74DRAFT_180833 [Aspergillus multicolor]|uniref:alpha/beta hydrolase family protein n=1 Tax=Aspergillus multicolor TaxID=41759 RepID=UPI003CCD2458
MALILGMTPFVIVSRIRQSASIPCQAPWKSVTVCVSVSVSVCVFGSSAPNTLWRLFSDSAGLAGRPRLWARSLLPRKYAPAKSTPTVTTPLSSGMTLENDLALLITGGAVGALAYHIGGGHLPVFLLLVLARLHDTADDPRLPRDIRRALGKKGQAHEPLDGDAFYGIPDTLNSDTRPGTVLRLVPHSDLSDYTIPSGLSMSRLMYASQSLNGTVVPVSAFVLWPYMPFNCTSSDSDYAESSGGPKFPIVAWAHGSTGLFAPCAPSNYRALQNNFMTVYSLALEEFAVVATDYAGLGVNTLPHGEQSHAWLAGPAGANDVAYAIKAARTAFPDHFEADGPFVTTGHSQGGHVAWAFTERMVTHIIAGYRGSIAISPPTDVVEWVRRAQRAVDLGTHSSTDQLPPWV